MGGYLLEMVQCWTCCTNCFRNSSFFGAVRVDLHRPGGASRVDVTFTPERQNTRRMKRITLVANTFEEERILRGLFDVMHLGGSVRLEINDDPPRGLVCDFAGEPKWST